MEPQQGPKRPPRELLFEEKAAPTVLTPPLRVKSNEKVGATKGPLAPSSGCRARGEPSTKSPRGGRVEEETPFFQPKTVPRAWGIHLESFRKHLKNVKK